MTWSYSGDPSATDLDGIRFLVGDVDTTDQLVQDEEILFLVDEYGNPYLAAAATAEAISAKFAREFAHSGDGLSAQLNQIQEHYADLAERLRNLAKRRRKGGLEPYVGGISWAEREKADTDRDKIPTSFRSHMHDYPGTADDQRVSHRDPLRGLDP